MKECEMRPEKTFKQAGAELGQAQLKLELELGCSSWIAKD